MVEPFRGWGLMSEALGFLAAIFGAALAAIVGGSVLGRWIAVRRITKAGIDLGAGSLFVRYDRLERMARGRHEEGWLPHG